LTPLGRGFLLCARLREGNTGRPVPLRLLNKQLAPAIRADLAFDEFACIRRLEISAALAPLVALRPVLILGGRPAELHLRRRLRDHGGDWRAERKRCTGEHGAARYAMAIRPAAAHMIYSQVRRYPVPPLTMNVWANKTMMRQLPLAARRISANIAKLTDLLQKPSLS
jgi:hypothetical protein